MPLLVSQSISSLYSNSISVRDILNVNLFISDMPMHDATRDLIMLNQSRMCQMELKWISILSLKFIYSSFQ